MIHAISAILALATITFLILFIRAFKRKTELERKYEGIIDIDNAIEKSKVEERKVKSDITRLGIEYKEKREIFEKLVKRVAIFDEEIELAELGFYKPHFDFGTSEEFKLEIANVKKQQKVMISLKIAIACGIEWTLEGSKAKGKTMINRGIRLTARAFNNECDVAISNTRWNNALKMEQRIVKAYESINKLNESNRIYISRDYLNLKIEELRLTHEYREKKQKEKEEQAEIKRQMREEAKLEKESFKAQKEEEKFQKMLERAKAEAEKATGAKLDKLNEKIESLGKELLEAHEKNQRAKSMAQQTKSGHVYIISNIGSFGEDVYKIGMTRRLEPLDRIKELGDASVPFRFDVHAMIYADDAPNLENQLHKKFQDYQVNLVNSRKEFFNVSLTQIEDEVKRISPNSEFIETAEAREYRESMALRSKQSEKTSAQDILNELPTEI